MIKNFIKPTKIGVLTSGICTFMLCFGIAHFSMIPMTAELQTYLGVSHLGIGILKAIHFWGVLSGFVIAWWIDDARLKDFALRYFLIVAALATVVFAAHHNGLAVWYASRFFTGLATGACFVLASGFLITWLQNNDYKVDLTLVFAGLGLGILISAAVVHFVFFEAFESFNWRLQWVALSGVGFMLLGPAFLLLPFPTEKEVSDNKDFISTRETLPQVSMTWLIVVHAALFCAGFGNSLFTSFPNIVATLHPDASFSVVWIAVGIAAFAAPVFAKLIVPALGEEKYMAIGLALTSIANIVLAFSPSFIVTLVASALIAFGVVSLLVVAIPKFGVLYGLRATKIIGQLAIAYGSGQAGAAVLSVISVYLTGSYTFAVVVSAVMCAGGIVCFQYAKTEGQNSLDTATAQ